MIRKIIRLPFDIVFHFIITSLDPYQHYKEDKKTGDKKESVLRGWKYETWILFALAAWIGMRIASVEEIEDSPIWIHWIVNIMLPMQIVRYARNIIIRLDKKYEKTEDTKENK